MDVEPFTIHDISTSQATNWFLQFSNRTKEINTLAEPPVSLCC